MKAPLIFLITLIIFLSIIFERNLIAQDVADEVLIELYDGARVADVVDGLATVGYIDVGVMDPVMAPLWKDVQRMSHRISGIAVTVRYGPTNHPKHPGADLTDSANYNVYRQWRGMWYNQLAPETFHEYIKPGTVLVIDNEGVNDAGSTGSKNIMEWINRGMTGLVSKGGVRDIDEIILQRSPVYTNYYDRGRGERIGRNEILDVQRPVVVGGVTVYPGDVIVADADGVVVVPRRVAARVGQIAYQELVDDIAGRRALYQELGLEFDDTVRIRETPEDFFRKLGLPADPNQ